MKWNSSAERCVISLAIILVLFNALVLTPATSAAPYVGGYFRSGKLTTQKVIMGANFPVLFLDVIPQGAWIGPVLSVAGGNPETSGYVYQAPLWVVRNGSIEWWPQIWYGAEMRWRNQLIIGGYNYIAYYVEILGINGGVADFKVFVYSTWTRYQYNLPIVYTMTAEINTRDTVFLVGNEDITIWIIWPVWSTTHRMNYFQFGVEASTHINGVDKWDIQNFHNAYYDAAIGQWRYLPGYSIRGSRAYITYIGNSVFAVGGEDYTGVDKYLTSDDAVRWRYTGTTIGNDVVLWTSSGTITPRPYA